MSSGGADSKLLGVERIGEETSRCRAIPVGFKVAVGVVMIAWFFLDVFLIGKQARRPQVVPAAPRTVAVSRKRR